jgi:hypothetical protein
MTADQRRDPADQPGPDAAVTAERIAYDVIAATAEGPVGGGWFAMGEGYEAVILGRLTGWLRAGLIPRCPHERTWEQLVWLAVPGCPVGCDPCVLAWCLANVTGTPEDGACDICHQPAADDDEIKEQRSIIMRAGVTQAITITYYVCAACLATEPARTATTAEPQCPAAR